MPDASLPEHDVFVTAAHRLMLRHVQRLGIPCVMLLAHADGQFICGSDADSARNARLAAMSGALLALSDSLSREALNVNNREVFLSSPQGHIIALRLTLRGQEHLLYLCTDAGHTLGSALRHARDLGARLQSLGQH